MKIFANAFLMLLFIPAVAFSLNLSEYGQTRLSLITRADSDRALLINELGLFGVSEADATSLTLRMLNSSDPENTRWAEQTLKDGERDIADNVAAIILAVNEGGAKHFIDYTKGLTLLPADRRHAAEYHTSFMQSVLSKDTAVLKVSPKYLEAYGKFVKEPMPSEAVEELRKEIDRLGEGDLDYSGENYGNFLYLFQIYLNQAEDTGFVLELLHNYFPNAGYENIVSFTGGMHLLANYDTTGYVELALELIDGIDEPDSLEQVAALEYLYAMRKHPVVGFYLEQKILHNPGPFYEKIDALIELLQYAGTQTDTGRIDTLEKLSERFRSLADKADQSREIYLEYRKTF